MKVLTRTLNIKGELFASTATYGASALVKLVSSLILTRLLDPSAYGVIGIIFSIAFVIELLSDVGAAALLIRHANGATTRFVHTLWTIRFIRSVFSFIVLYACAPIISQAYDLPVLEDALRLFSPWFLLAGMESMAFIIGQRNQQAKIGNYVDLFSSLASAILVIYLATVIQNYSVFIYGVLVQRALNSLASHFFYREFGVRFAFDLDAIRAQFNFAKVVLPSSVLTILLSQYDKVVLLRIFDLFHLGIYGLAGGMIGPIGGLVMHNCRVILYPRCAAYFREQAETAGDQYYANSAKLARVIMFPPMIIAGFSFLIVALLYDNRYQGAGAVLLALALGVFLGAAQGMSENLLVASGRTTIVLQSNVIRILLIAPLTLTGYYFAGFMGFVWGAVLTQVPVLVYCYFVQHKAGLLRWRIETRRLGEGLIVFLVCLAIDLSVYERIPSNLLATLFK